MANGSHPPAELHERLLICRTIKLNAGAHGGHRRCCHAQIQKNAQNKPQIARLILCVHTTLQVYCNLFLTFCRLFLLCFPKKRTGHLPRMNRMPNVFGPQWQEMVQPAVVSMTSVNFAYLPMDSRTASTVPSGQGVWVIKMRS